jgi:Zn-dependent oligopeptidase
MEAWDEDEGLFLGYIYLDMHPREFKRSGSGHWRLNQVNPTVSPNCTLHNAIIRSVTTLNALRSF